MSFREKCATTLRPNPAIFRAARAKSWGLPMNRPRKENAGKFGLPGEFYRRKRLKLVAIPLQLKARACSD
jgi:hypothetical protein